MNSSLIVSVSVLILLCCGLVVCQIEEGGIPTAVIPLSSPPLAVTVEEVSEELWHFFISMSGVVIQTNNTDIVVKYNVPSTDVPLGDAAGLAVDSPNGFLYAADTDNNRIIQWNILSTEVTGIWSNGLSHPYGLAVDTKGHVIVADAGNDRLVKYDNTGKLLMSYTTQNPSLAGITGVEINMYDGSDDIWVVDTGNMRLVRFASNSSKVLSIVKATLPPSPYAWVNPVGMSITQSGWMFLADSATGYVLGYSSANSSPSLQEYYRKLTPDLNYTMPTSVAGSLFSMVVADQKNQAVGYYLYC